MLRDVTKVYGDGKMACNKISFNLFRNEIFALLGRNGAGKTSLINVLIGMYDATSGQAIYKENNILEESNMNEFRNKLGICPQHDILFPKLTVREHLEMFCYFKGFDITKIKDEVDNTLKDFRIHDIENILAGTLSAGQRRKLSIAISVIGGSEVIFLDEPSSGMDITSRRNLWEILKKIIEKRIIILTTHYMEEASVLGNRIGIMAEGVLKCIGTPLFLIEKYGKYLSVNIYKEKDADNDEIIEYFKSKAEGIESEILTQEILIRIPKNKPGTDTKNINIQSFFEDLDNNVKKLKIKNYSASMPTLEDVFLNIGSVRLEEEEMLQSGKIDEEKNEKILFKQKYIKDFTKTEKFFFDAVALLKKRGFQIFRDTKTFMLEILCPILLVIVGCLVVQIDIFEDSKPIKCNKETLAKFGNQIIYYGDFDNNENIFTDNFKFDSTNVTTSFLSTETTPSNAVDGLQKFIEKLYEKEHDSNSLNNYGALYSIKSNSNNKQYNVIQVVNGKARQSPMMYAYLFMNQILSKNDIKFEFTHYPLPTTYDNQDNSKALNNFCLVFFVSIAFSLIPANFISSIVSERINNSKHLMRISGVSIFAYWLINFLFELIKYYFTAGICLLILWAFDFVPKYFYSCYLLYGPSMIMITYLISFFFNSEAVAQNFLILFNLVFGSLGSTVIIMLRAINKTTNAAKIAAYFIRIIPSFAFGYGYNLLLNGKLILFIDYSIGYLTKPKSIYISLEYAGSDALYLGITFVVYIIGIIIIEYNAYRVEEVNDNLLSEGEDKKLDKQVEKEIKKANQMENIELDDDDIMFNNKNRNNANTEMNTEKNNLIEIDERENKDIVLNINDKSRNKNKDYSTDNKTKDVLNSANEQILDQGNYKGINKDDYAVRIKNMQKIYNNGCNIISKPTMGVKNISFTVNYGECFGLLGLNGAGKTTIFKAITEEHSPTHGSIYINGLNLTKNFDRVKLMFGYCPQFDAIFPYMSVYENLEFYSRIKGVAPEKLQEIIQAMIESMTLTKYTNKLAGRLSGGNKRKLSVAISMICNPPIVLLDEPSTGMDPEARRFMWAVIHKLTSKSDSNCVIMTTHAMDEAETLCRRMGIMVNGEFVCLGTSNYIKETYGYGYEIDIRIKPFEQSKLNEIIEKLGLKRNYKILTLDEAKDILKKINKENYCKYLEKEGIGRKIYHEVTVNGDINLQALINWSRYVACAMKMIKVVLPHFNEVILSEFIENNFLFKIKKSADSKSIGFLFTLLEKEKESCEITEYSIQQTSLEQIFNKFAENQGKTEEDIKNTEKVDNDIHIDDKLVNDLI
jgi:ATP-binding cassette subfamily A (ABC1) protein 3